MIKRDTAALVAFIDSRQLMPHKSGRAGNDCVSYALAAAKAQTGIDVAPEHDWSTARQGLAIIRRFGSLEAAFDAHFERVPPAQAMRGDIAGVPDDKLGVHPMIVDGVMLVGPGDQGNRRLPRSAMTVAWSIVRPKGGHHV